MSNFEVIIIAVLGIFISLGLYYGLKVCARAQRTEWGKAWLNYLDGLNRLFCRYYHRFEYIPIQLPPTGPAVILANHVSGLDPFLLFAATERPLHFLIAKEQYNRFGLTWLFRAVGCIPVDRQRRPDQALRMALRALESGKVIVLFPQGTIVLPGESRPLKKGGMWLAQQTESPIYTVHISGIAKAGHIFRSILFRSRAKLIVYPTIYWTVETHLEMIQTWLEGKD